MIIILENIRSCHNVGAIFRTADGAGCEKIFLAGYTPAPPDRRIEKVSLGAENFLQWEKIAETKKICEKLRAKNFKILALEQTEKSQNLFFKKKFDQKIALILGNEITGISAETLDFCDEILEIPMRGQKSSLNVSVAAGVAFFWIAQNFIKN